MEEKIIANLKDGLILDNKHSLHISGYASVFNVVDSNNEVILSSAEILYHNPIALLWQHDTKNPIGKVVEINKNNRGLYVKAQMPFMVKKVQEVFWLLESNILSGLSLGYKVIRGFYKDDILHIKKILICEISIVTMPANRFARLEKHFVRKD